MRSVLYNGGLYFASDPAIKEDIQAASLSRCVDLVEKLPLKRYSYVSAYRSTFAVQDVKRLGFLTSDVKPHFPKSISKVHTSAPFLAEDPSTLFTVGHESLDSAQIRMAHLGATKALLSLIETLEGEVDILTEEIGRLRCKSDEHLERLSRTNVQAAKHLNKFGTLR
jgi:hypothetical protein